MNPKNIVYRFMWPVLIILIIALFILPNQDTSVKTLIYSELAKEVDAATIKKIVFYSDGTVEGEFKSAKDGLIRFKSKVGEDDSAYLSRKLESQDPVPEIRKENAVPPPWLGLLSWVLPIILLVGFWYFIMGRIAGGGMGGGLSNFMKSKAKLNQDLKPVFFKDVAGADEAKAELKEIVDFLGYPHKFAKLGGRIPKGVLLVGSPGVGKTLLARAVAGEAHVPFFSISGSDFVEAFVGVGAARVRDLFEDGKKKSPCIIFIDELDAVGRHRGTGMGSGHDEREQTLNALLVEMDGFESNTGVIIMAATNRPDVLDPALLRPGRFDRQVVMAKPDIKGRQEILKIHGEKILKDDSVDFEIIAKGTPGFTGADLENLCNEAALHAGRNNKQIVTMDDFEFAKDKVVMGGERSIVISPKEKEVTAVHESGHAIVASLVPKADPVHKVTIIPRGMSMGSTSQLPEDDRHNYSKTYLKSQLAILLAGRCAEEIILGEVSTGASNDIKRATDISQKMVCSWGMSEKIGPLNFDTGESDNPFLGKRLGESAPGCSPDTAREIDEEMKLLIVEAKGKATQILREKIDVLRKMADTLMEKENMTGEEVRNMLS